jgi:hypothetical protein
MKKYRLIHSLSTLLIFIIKIFYPQSGKNISHNVNQVFNSTISEGDAKNLGYFIIVLSVMINYFMFDKHKIFIALYYFLIAFNMFFIILCLKQF